MARYIDAEKVMEDINRIGGHNLCEWDTLGVKALIGRQPTADVVEVVRCKDCEWWEAYSYGSTVGRCQNPINGLVSEYSDDEDYCSYGKRRDT